MKTKIFKKGDKVKYIKEPTEVDWLDVGEVSIPFKINDILEVYGQNIHSSSIYFKEKGFSYPNVCFELHQETHKYEVVHTETQEQWNFVYKKTNSKQGNNWYNYKNYTGFCLNMDEYTEIKWYREQNSKIYTFEEWLDKFGHKSEYLKQNQKEEQWIPQVGDYIITKGYSDSYDGRILKITKTDSNRYYYFEVFDKGYYDKNHNFGKKAILRKALPHEIPTQELSKEDLLAEAERRYPVGTQFKSALIGDTNPYVGYVKKGMYFSKSENVIWNGDSVGFIYHNGTWAEIVEEPKVKANKIMPEIIDELKYNNWDVLSTTLGSIMYSTDSYKSPYTTSVKNNKILPIKVRNSNITESTTSSKRTKIKIIKKQLLTI